MFFCERLAPSAPEDGRQALLTAISPPLLRAAEWIRLFCTRFVLDYNHIVFYSHTRRASLSGTMPYDSHLRKRFLDLRSNIASLQRQVAHIRARRSLERRHDPNQPRVPAGSPGGGRWSDGDGGSVARSRHDQEVLPRDERAKINSGSGRMTLAGLRTLAECAEQYKRDSFQCKIVGSRSCWAQAKVREVACEQGRPIPPLNY
jgi:hypothetical protein